MANSTKRSPLLLKLMARMAEVEFREEYIPQAKDGCDIYGLWDSSGVITINPIPHVVTTVVHELLHEAKPDYSERAVRSMVGKLMKQLTEEEMITIYEEYRRQVDGE
jgi:hypothetical protein